MIKTYLENFASYNFWTNRQIIAFLKRQDRAFITRPVISSFPSIESTLSHIYDAEHIWYQRIIGLSPERFPASNHNHNIEDLYEKLELQSQLFENYCRKEKEDGFHQIISYFDTAKNAHELKLADLLLHVFNHSSFHRGQMITLSRQLNLANIPRTDFVHFLRIIGQEI